MIKIFALIVFLPHVLVYLFSSKKDMITEDLYSRSQRQTKLFVIILDLSLRLFKDKYFRTLFYYRNPGIITKGLRVFYPKDKYFIIDVNTILGKGVQLAHPYSTILNAERIGDNLYVNHLVTVGEKNGKRPKIGDNVQLHAGAMVIGGVNVGNNAVIGAGTVVVKDVPENAIVVGNPSKIIGLNTYV